MRGAWIEMLCIRCMVHSQGSLPMRGAWIEIQPVVRPKTLYIVAPHAGGVDRNLPLPLVPDVPVGRSPCGGRG